MKALKYLKLQKSLCKLILSDKLGSFNVESQL